MADTFDVVAVGAGFAGMFALHRARARGLRVTVLEAGGDVGGTWYHNNYPGARCDIESLEYSFQFDKALQQEWNWTEKYATQPEILKYASHVADRFDLRKDIRFNTRLDSATWKEDLQKWELKMGDTVLLTQFLVMATGCLSAPNFPKFEGEKFQGDTYHTGQWPEAGVDFTGKRVAVVGTGSSGIQSIPHLAKQAKKLFVMQRTANYSLPARNKEYEPAYVDQWKARYDDVRALNKLLPFGLGALKVPPTVNISCLDADPEFREKVFEERWQQGGLPFLFAFSDLYQNEKSNQFAQDFIHRKIKATVNDPAVAALLTPKTNLGCKRPCVDTDYYQTFNRDNVQLVDVAGGGPMKMSSSGFVVGNTAYDVDCVVFATGYDAMTGALFRIDIKGRNGLTLKEKWADGPVTYLGLQTSSFPNLFTVTGPGSPSVLTNMIPSIEQHVNWIDNCIGHMVAIGAKVIEPTVDAETDWVGQVAATIEKTVLSTCDSWYSGANIPGKPRVFYPYSGFPEYVKKCEEITSEGYVGFNFTNGEGQEVETPAFTRKYGLFKLKAGRVLGIPKLLRLSGLLGDLVPDALPVPKWWK